MGLRLNQLARPRTGPEDKVYQVVKLAMVSTRRGYIQRCNVFARHGVRSSQAASNRSWFSDWLNNTGHPNVSEYFGASSAPTH